MPKATITIAHEDGTVEDIVDCEGRYFAAERDRVERAVLNVIHPTAEAKLLAFHEAIAEVYRDMVGEPEMGWIAGRLSRMLEEFKP